MVVPWLEIWGVKRTFHSISSQKKFINWHRSTLLDILEPDTRGI
jgi:hypothetical protein